MSPLLVDKHAYLAALRQVTNATFVAAKFDFLMNRITWSPDLSQQSSMHV